MAYLLVLSEKSSFLDSREGIEGLCVGGFLYENFSFVSLVSEKSRESMIGSFGAPQDCRSANMDI